MSQNLRNAANLAARALASAPDPARRKRAADEAIGFWLAAALDDQGVCERMKHDITEWLEANEQLATATKLARLLAIAQIQLRATEPDEPDLAEMPSQADAVRALAAFHAAQDDDRRRFIGAMVDAGRRARQTVVGPKFGPEKSRCV